MPAIEQFLADRFPVLDMIATSPGPWDEGLGPWFTEHWEQFVEWASQPYVIYAALAWIITFCLVCVIILGAGFGPAGIAAGSIAAGFQALMYGAFTPAGGIFATLTSIGMLGALMPAALVAAMVLATGVAAIVWFCGVGR